MKISSFFEFKKIIKGTLAIVLASSFTFSSLAFADDNTTEPATYETVDLQAVQSQLESTQAEAPSLIPGDFFYFAKIAFEKIKLAVTFDNSEEAKLMATYASERLAEAGALYGEGNETEALKVIQAAIDYIENSQNIVDEETRVEDTTDQGSTDDSTDEVTSDESNQTQDETATDDGTSEEEKPYTEVEDTLRHNIAALSAAMTHVGNDQAKASLQRNIDKTYAKIAKKLDKLEKKYGKVDSENQVIEATNDVDLTEAPDVSGDNPVLTNDVEPTVDTVTAPESTNIADMDHEAVVVKSKGAQKEKVHANQQVKLDQKKEQANGKSAEAGQKGNKEKDK